MRDIQAVKSYFYAAYAVTAVIYGVYIASLVVRARRARERLSGSPRKS